MGQKMKFFNFEIELEEKLDRHSDVKFDGKSYADDHKAQNVILKLTI